MKSNLFISPRRSDPNSVRSAMPFESTQSAAPSRVMSSAGNALPTLQTVLDLPAFRGAELISGSREAAIGKTTGDFVPAERAEASMAHDRQIIESRETITVEEVLQQEDGDHVYVSLKFPLLDSGGHVCASAGISTDITEQLRARKVNQELTLARSFQGKLYPKEAPATLGIDVAGSATALAQLCGDYYDYIEIGPKRLMVSIADVSGHGIASALQMAQTRGAVRGLARRGLDPSLINRKSVV